MLLEREVQWQSRAIADVERIKGPAFKQRAAQLAKMRAIQAAQDEMARNVPTDAQLQGLQEWGAEEAAAGEAIAPAECSAEDFDVQAEPPAAPDAEAPGLPEAKAANPLEAEEAAPAEAEAATSTEAEVTTE